MSGLLKKVAALLNDGSPQPLAALDCPGPVGSPSCGSQAPANRVSKRCALDEAMGAVSPKLCVCCGTCRAECEANV